MNTKLQTSWIILRTTFAAVPIIAGLDKFTNFLAHWADYLNPAIASLLPVSPRVFMGVAGVIEIAAGLIVIARPRIGAFIVMAWLICIGLSLLASGRFLDVAVRDLVMAVGAYTLASLTPVVKPIPTNQ